MRRFRVGPREFAYIDKRHTRSPFGSVDIEQLKFPAPATSALDYPPTAMKKALEAGISRLDTLFDAENKRDFFVRCIVCRDKAEYSIERYSDLALLAAADGWRIDYAWKRSNITWTGWIRKSGWLCPDCQQVSSGPAPDAACGPGQVAEGGES